MMAVDNLAAPSPDLKRVEAFLFNEAKLLDDGRFEEWRALFAEDAYYWVPLRPEQTEPTTESSIICDDIEMMETLDPSLKASAGTRTNSTIAHCSLCFQRDAGGHMTRNKQQYTVSSAIQMVEYRKTQQLTYAARCRHVLR